jgi:hypothetical protein
VWVMFFFGVRRPESKPVAASADTEPKARHPNGAVLTALYLRYYVYCTMPTILCLLHWKMLLYSLCILNVLTVFTKLAPFESRRCSVCAAPAPAFASTTRARGGPKNTQRMKRSFGPSSWRWSSRPLCGTPISSLASRRRSRSGGGRRSGHSCRLQASTWLVRACWGGDGRTCPCHV